MRAAATCTSFCAAGRRLTSANTSRIFLARCSSVSGFEASSRSPLVATKPIVLPGKQAVHGVGPLRSLPRWDRTDSSALLSSTSTKRWIEGKERRYTEFGSSKQWKTLSHREAMDQYLLRRRDLEGLPFVAKYNVYGETGEHTGPPRLTRFYVVYDVQDRALRRWGSAAAMNDEHERRRQVRERRRARLQPPALMLLRPVRVRKGQVVVGSRAVFAAIVGNCGVVVAKLAGWGVSGSGSMLSEAFHSMADLGNQVMLAIGLQQSMRRPDVSRPYGYGYEQYVWAMISGVSTFILGAGASVYHGVQLLLNPTELESLPTAVAVLGFAGAMESYTLSVAFQEIKREATKHGMTIRQYLIDGPDPLNPAVLLEDSVAVVGVGVAAGSITLTHMTGNPTYDAAGSIVVGTMMGAVALFIIDRNRKFLGGTVPRRTENVVSMLLADEMVLSVQDVKSVMVGPSAARFKAEIHFNPQLLSEKYLSAHNNLAEACKSCQQVGNEAEAKLIFERYSVFLLATLSMEVDRLEHLISSAFPEFQFIDLEVL